MENKFNLIAKLSFATTNIINNFGMENKDYNNPKNKVNTNNKEIIENSINDINSTNNINNLNNINNINNINLNNINNFNSINITNNINTNNIIFVNPDFYYGYHNFYYGYPDFFYYNNDLNYIKEDIAEIIVNDNDDDNSIEHLKFTSNFIYKNRFDDFLHCFIINYRNFKVLNLGRLNISKNLYNLRSLFYVKEPETVVVNKKNISYFYTPILADYDTYNVKKIVLENINQSEENITNFIINLNDDFYNTFILITFSLKTLYNYENTEQVKKSIDHLINRYHNQNKYLLNNLNKLKRFKRECNKEDKTYEYYYYYIMDINNSLNFKIKLSYFKLKKVEDNKRNFIILDFKTERIFRRKKLATTLFGEILDFNSKDISFLVVSPTKGNTAAFLKSLGFIHLKFIKSWNMNIFNKYCKKFNLSEINSQTICNGTMVYNSKLNDDFIKNNTLLKEKYNNYFE